MKRYKDAFSPVPQETQARVEETLRTLPRRADRQARALGRPRWAVALVAALVLTLCGGAVAAERLGVLDFLFGLNGPTEEQQQLVQDVNLTQKADMATVTVTDAVFDGRQLSMGLVFNVERPTYAVPQQIWLNGQPQPINSNHLMWLSQDKGQKEIATGLSAVTDESFEGPVEVRLQLALYQPRKDVKLLTEEDSEETILHAIADGFTPLYADDWTFPSMLGGTAPLAQYNLDAEDVELVFTIESSKAYQGETVYLDVTNNDDLPFTVIVRRAELTLVGSHFVLDIYPKEGGIENPADLERFVMNPFYFWEDRAKMLEFQSSSTNQGEGGWKEDAQGQTFYRFVEETGPIPELPENVWLVFESTPSYHSLWQWAIELRPTDTPSTQEVPVAETAGIIPGNERPFHFFHGDAVVNDGTLQCTAAMSANEGQEDAFNKLWRMWDIYDLKGAKLSMIAGGADYEAADAGPDVFTITQNVALPDELPDAVYLVPVDWNSGEANWDYAILLPVGQD